jgi:nucleotide-binding universal stress UspA family protein
VTPPVWTRIAKIGDPADILADEAQDIHAGMILIGAGRHGTVERILSRPTALRVIEKTDLPIVVVPRGSKPPGTVVVGADLIAIGSHGYNLAQRAMLGSVSAALLARPAQAVLVTRATEA